MSEFAPVVPEGWTVYKTVDGWGATKRFDDHYGTIEVAADGDLAGACSALDREKDLRIEAAKQAEVATADDLRSQADALVADASDLAPAVEVVALVAPDVVAEPAPTAPVEDSAPVVDAVTPVTATEPAADSPQP